MARKRYTAEQIIVKPREAEVLLAQRMTVAQMGRQVGITEQTYYRRRKACGGEPSTRVPRPPNASPAGTRHWLKEHA